jgi:hypothetical protein
MRRALLLATLAAALFVPALPASAALPPEISDSLLNSCALPSAATQDYLDLASDAVLAIDADHAIVSVCDSPLLPCPPDVSCNSNAYKMAISGANPVVQVGGPLPAIRAGQAFDFGQHGHPLGSWLAAVVALPPARTVGVSLEQTNCEVTSPFTCSVNTLPSTYGPLVRDDDSLRSRRIRVGGWPYQDAPGNVVEPLFSARCEKGCATAPISFTIAVTLADRANGGIAGTRIDLGPYPITVPDKTTLRFRLPIPAAVQLQVLSHINRGPTRFARFVVTGITSAPNTVATGFLTVQKKSYRTGAPTVIARRPFARIAEASRPAATVARRVAKPAVRATLTLAELGGRSAKIVVTGKAPAKAKTVKVVVRLQAASGAAATRWATVGKAITKTVTVKHGTFTLRLTKPVTYRSGQLLRVTAKVGKKTGSSTPTTMLRGW